jgi:hypothetical protein
MMTKPMKQLARKRKNHLQKRKRKNPEAKRSTALRQLRKPEFKMLQQIHLTQPQMLLCQ